MVNRPFGLIATFGIALSILVVAYLAVVLAAVALLILSARTVLGRLGSLQWRSTPRGSRVRLRGALHPRLSTADRGPGARDSMGLVAGIAQGTAMSIWRHQCRCS